VVQKRVRRKEVKRDVFLLEVFALMSAAGGTVPVFSKPVHHVSDVTTVSASLAPDEQTFRWKMAGKTGNTHRQ